ncbi:MAG: hypothetical protein ACPG97_05430 [Paracoccaceae bacterium]
MERRKVQRSAVIGFSRRVRPRGKQPGDCGERARRDRGVQLTVSTDDPPFFHTDMTKEYAALSHAFGWGKEDFSSLNKTAIKAAFCDTATKDTIIKRLDAE